jgi:hypothetical protein
VIYWFGFLVLVEGVRSERRKVIVFVTKKNNMHVQTKF